MARLLLSYLQQPERKIYDSVRFSGRLRFEPRNFIQLFPLCARNFSFLFVSIFLLIILSHLRGNWNSSKSPLYSYLFSDILFEYLILNQPSIIFQRRFSDTRKIFFSKNNSSNHPTGIFPTEMKISPWKLFPDNFSRFRWNYSNVLSPLCPPFFVRVAAVYEKFSANGKRTMSAREIPFSKSVTLLDVPFNVIIVREKFISVLANASCRGPKGCRI